MTKRQLIEQIQQLNQSVETNFLTQFDEEALKQYLTQLQSAAENRITIANWVRRQPSKLRLVS